MLDFVNRRNFLRFLFETLLIVLSLLLALFLNEYRNQLNERKLTRTYIERLQQELTSNQEIIAKTIPYHKEVFANVREAYQSDSIRKVLYANGRLQLKQLAPRGLVQSIPSSVAWEITKQSGLSRNFDFELLYSFSKTYDQQKLVLDVTLQRLNDEVFKTDIYLPENQEETLYFFMITMNELYTQEQSLLNLINASLEKIEKLKM